MPKVSFIVIGFNIDKYIYKCLDSILNQNLLDIEIIYVDDGSTDQTISIVEKLMTKDRRIKILKQKNSGANSARKNGLRLATGEYILFVDGDDWVDTHCAQNLYNHTQNYKYDIVAFNYYKAYDYKKIEGKIFLKANSILEEYGYLELILQQKLSHNLWNKFYKREFLITNGFLDISSITMGDDLVANVQLGINKPNVLVINEAYYYYYQRINSVTKKISPKVLEIKKSLIDIENILKKHDMYNSYRKEIDYLWFRHTYICFVVLSRHPKSYIQKNLYTCWKKKGIKVDKNLLCKEYIKELGFMKRILILLYNIHYELGYISSRIFLKLRKKEYGE